ncbi:MAG: DsbA family protein [Arenimonas sp.]|jgi:2-hydroxychromene-2-carboxylate isomerase
MSTGHDWYFDFISPFAYLQWMRLRRDHPELRLRPRPLLLAGLLKHWGQLGPAEIAGKRRHTYRLALWQARQLQIPLRFPPAHPFNPLPALRLALAAPDLPLAVNLLFRHLWERGLAGDSAEALATVAAELGIDDVAAALARDDIKRRLADTGAEAIALGVFGVPTLVIDGQLFWGNDATGMALQFLGHAALFDDPEMRRLDALPFAAQRPGTRT